MQPIDSFSRNFFKLFIKAVVFEKMFDVISF